jgi:hypothetical protein
MDLVIYGINFSPELTGIGKYTGEMVHWLRNAATRWPSSLRRHIILSRSCITAIPRGDTDLNGSAARA